MAFDEHREAPPLGEEVHLPGPSILPLIVAAAIAVALVGVTTEWYLIVFGLTVLAWCVVRWVRDTRRDVAELPVEHD